MPDTVPLELKVRLRREFSAKLIVPLDLKPKELRRIVKRLEEHVTDPSDSEKFAVCDPNILPEIPL